MRRNVLHIESINEPKVKGFQRFRARIFPDASSIVMGMTLYVELEYVKEISSYSRMKDKQLMMKSFGRTFESSLLVRKKNKIFRLL